MSTPIPVPPGLVLNPFRALRFTETAPGWPAALTSPPYDVIDDRARAELAAASPANIVQLILPREEPGDGEGNRYRRAAETMSAWRRHGWLQPDRDPALYVYEIAEPGGHRVRGLLGAVGLAPPEAGIVLPHENTMAGPVADRLALARATESDLEPIFLLYDGGGAATHLVDDLPARAAPILAFVDGAGLQHRLWAEADPGILAAVAADLLPRRAVIADGHHRYATYLQHQTARHAAGSGPGPWDHGLALLVDAAHGPRVEPVHRVVRGISPEQAFDRVRAALPTRDLDGSPQRWATELGAEPGTAPGAAAERAPRFVLAGPGGAVLVTARPAGQLSATVRQGPDAQRSEAWAQLDVTVAHRWLVPQVLGVADSEENVGYAHDVTEALELAEASRAAGVPAVALLLAPTPTGQVLAVAAAGERMPRKSTLFMPKPRSGLVLRSWQDQG